MILRPRRLRRTPTIRSMVEETWLRSNDLIYPLFVKHGRGEKEPIPAMVDQYRFSVDELVKEAEEVWSLGIPAIMLFGLPKNKDPLGSEAYAQDGIVQQAVAAVKNHVPELILLTDVCLCQYTDHGHCGVVKGGQVDNDATLDILSQIALSHARAGAAVLRRGRPTQRHFRAAPAAAPCGGRRTRRSPLPRR